LTVAVFIQFLEGLGSLGDFFCRKDTVAIGVQDGHQRDAGRAERL
jgi:hypothetical protein